MVKPLGESRQFQDVCIEMAKRLDIDLGFTSTEDFMKKSCEMTHIDYEELKARGVWVDPKKAKPLYMSYAKELKPEKYTGETVIFDTATGVYWDWKKSKAKSREEAAGKGYSKT